MSAISELIVRVRGQDHGAIGLMDRLALEMRKNRAELEGLQSVSHGLGTASRVAFGGAMVLGGGLLYAGKQGAEFTQELRNANTMLRLDDAGFAQLGGSVLDIARDPLITSMPKNLASGVYDLASSGIKGNDGLQTLRAGAIAATGAGEEASVAMSVLSDVMNAYNTKTGPDAVRIMDQLWASVDIGKFRFGDLAGQIGPMVAVAAPLGVKLEEIAAATALLTNKGFTYSEAATAVERAMTVMLSPTDALKKTMKEMGYESAVAMLKQEGLAGAMQVLEKSAQGNQAELAALFGNVRALRAAMALGGAAAGEYSDMIGYIRNSTGAAGRAATEVARGPMFQWKKALQEVNVEVTDLAQKDLAPIGTEFLKELREGIAAFRALSPEQKDFIVHLALGATKALLLAGGLAAIGAGVTNIIGLYNAGKGTLGALGAILGKGATAAAGGAAADVAGAAAGGGGGLLGLLGGLKGGRGAKAASAAAAAAAKAGRMEDLMGDFKFFKGLSLPAGSGGWKRGMNAFSELKDAGLVGGARRAKTAILEVWSAQTKLAWANELSASSSLKSGKAMWAWASQGNNWTALLGKMGGAAKGFGGILAGLPGKLASIGSGLVSFLVSPAGIAMLAIVGLAIELGALWKSYQTMKKAQDEAKQAKANERAAEDAAGQTGTVNFDSQARSIGYSDKDIGALSNAVNDPKNKRYAEAQRISKLVMERNARASVAKSAKQKADVLAADTAARQAAANAAQPSPPAATPTAEASTAPGAWPGAGGEAPGSVPGVYGAAYGGGGTFGSVRRGTGTDALGQKSVTINITAGLSEIRKLVNQELDEQFGAA